MSRATQGVKIRIRPGGGKGDGKVRVNKRSGGTVIHRYQKDGVKYIRVQKYNYKNQLVSDKVYKENQ